METDNWLNITPSSSIEIRLVGGSTKNEGRIEIRGQGKWGTVCDDSFGLDDANVICKMLGYPSAFKAFQGGDTKKKYGLGGGEIIFDDLKCTGTENSLFECPLNGLFKHNCGHSEDASVICKGN